MLYNGIDTGDVAIPCIMVTLGLVNPKRPYNAPHYRKESRISNSINESYGNAIGNFARSFPKRHYNPLSERLSVATLSRSAFRLFHDVLWLYSGNRLSKTSVDFTDQQQHGKEGS
jgi:hypothetical protein